MSKLLAKADFWEWLERHDAYVRIFADDDVSLCRDRCTRCEGSIEEQYSLTGECLVCLAEQYGRDQSEAAWRVGAALMVALVNDDMTPTDVLRRVVEDVFAERDPEIDGVTRRIEKEPGVR